MYGVQIPACSAWGTVLALFYGASTVPRIVSSAVQRHSHNYALLHLVDVGLLVGDVCTETLKQGAVYTAARKKARKQTGSRLRTTTNTTW